MATTVLEVLERIKAHLLKQGRKAADAGGNCKYRVEDHEWGVLRCAAGCLLKDELYSTALECNPVDTYFLGDAFSKSLGIDVRDWEDNYTFWVRQAQGVHDGFPLEKWESQMDRIIQDYKDRILDPEALRAPKL